MQEMSAMCHIDQGLISKYESGKRLPSESHLKRLAKVMDQPFSELRKDYLAERIHDMLAYEYNALEILEAAETRLEYLRADSAIQPVDIDSALSGKLEKLDDLQMQWKERKPLDHTQLRKMEEYFTVRYTYDSNRIEGNTLTLQETHLVVNQGLTVGGKSLREHLEAVNHHEAAEWIYELATGGSDLDQRTLLDLHRIVLKTIDSDHAGRYRSVPVRISGSDHVPPEPYLIDKMMEDFFLFYTSQKSVLHPIVLAAEMHERLVRIHPFIDENGRTARLIMNFILLKHGWTIVILKGDNRSRMKYYEALEGVHADNEPQHFHHLIADHAIESIKEHLSMT